MGAGAGAKATAASASTAAAKSYANAPLSQMQVPHTGLEIIFCDKDYSLRKLTFHKKPLGFEIILGQMPMVVRSCHTGGWAEKLGVEAGWTVAQVNGRDFKDGAFEESMSYMVRHIEALPRDPHVARPAVDNKSVEITFDTGSHEKNVIFVKRPLGLEFNVEAPIRIINVGEDSTAQRLGVQVGWTMKKVDGEDLEGMTFSEQFKLLKRHMLNLPDAYAAVAPHAGLTVHSDITGAGKGAEQVI